MTRACIALAAWALVAALIAGTYQQPAAVIWKTAGWW